MNPAGEALKKLRFGYSFLRKRLCHVNLQVSYSCNFHCQICDFWKEDYRDKPRMTLGQVHTIAERLRPAGPQIVSVGGGEPLMHPDIVNIAGILSRNNFVAMICNGWFVTPEMARALFSAGIYEVSVSVDYADPAKHDAQRGCRGAFDRAIKALEILRKARSRADQRVHMISVLMNDNLDDIEPLIELSRKIGVTYLVTLYSDNRGTKTPRSPSMDIASRLLALKARYPEFVAVRGYLERFTEAVAHGGIYPCMAGRNLLNIDSQGNVTLCIDQLENPTGNIFVDPLSEILAGTNERQRNGNCSGCWTSCRGTVESLMYGRRFVRNLLDYYRMTKAVPLKR